MSYGSYTELVLYGELPTRQEPVASHLERWCMEASLTRRVLRYADVREWAWWKLAAAVTAAVAATQMTWHAADAWKFALLLSCGLISVAATPRVVYTHGGITRDFITVWVLPIAILLPPFYAMVTPIPLYVLTQFWVFRGTVYRRVFTVGAIALSYGAASVLFRAFPASFAGGAIGTGVHALTWAVAVALAEQVGRRGHQVLIVGGIKLTDPTIKFSDLEFNREALVADFAEFDLGVLITIVVAVSPLLSVFAVPTVLLVRRFMMHGQLLAKSRIDTKTGLLNASTWEQEAEAEIARAVRTGTPLALALVDIDHFKAVNDTYGHLAGDKTLRAVTDGLRSQLRSYDLAGRFGGEEFAILLPHARETDALNIAERLRTHIAALSVPVGTDPDGGPSVQVTISVGVASLNGESRELTDMMAAADAALYYAKETGRNKTHVITASAPTLLPGPAPRHRTGALSPDRRPVTGPA
jgi:diguanylate cyclase (GGDEF)-like protein